MVPQEVLIIGRCYYKVFQDLVSLGSFFFKGDFVQGNITNHKYIVTKQRTMDYMKLGSIYAILVEASSPFKVLSIFVNFNH